MCLLMDNPVLLQRRIVGLSNNRMNQGPGKIRPLDTPLAWALLLSLILHAMLVLLIAPSATVAPGATNTNFTFLARMQPDLKSSSTIEIVRTPEPVTVAAQPPRPPQDLPAMDIAPTAPADRYYEVKELDTAPAPKQQVEPQYPATALAAKASGIVQLEMFVDENGEIVALSVLRSTAPGLFDQAAIDAFRDQQFAPGMRNGMPVKTHLKLIVNFGEHPDEDHKGK